MPEKNKIKCSMCDMEFPSGISYRKHWIEAHLIPLEMEKGEYYERN